MPDVSSQIGYFMTQQLTQGQSAKDALAKQLTAPSAKDALGLEQPPEWSRYMMEQKPKGLVSAGNIDITNRPFIKNADGSISTEYSFSRDQNGVEVLVPSIVGGKWMTPDGKMPRLGREDPKTGKYIPTPEEKAMQDKAWKHYLETGEHLGKFSNPADADAYAKTVHNRFQDPNWRGGEFWHPAKIQDGYLPSYPPGKR